MVVLALPLARAHVAPAAPYARANPIHLAIETMEGVGPETGNKVFDPLNIAGSVSDPAVAWMRAAELKHGRVAMIATVGYLVTAAGIHFPGELAKGVTFASVAAAGPYDALSAVPAEGKLQIAAWALMMEIAQEAKKPHYTRGGVPGKLDALPFDGVEGIWVPKIKFWDPLNFLGNLSEEQKAKKRVSELKNGRLAMIAIMSFFAGHAIPGSVPLLPPGAF